jgi:hypothetical protein
MPTCARTSDICSIPMCSALKIKFTESDRLWCLLCCLYNKCATRTSLSHTFTYLFICYHEDWSKCFIILWFWNISQTSGFHVCLTFIGLVFLGILWVAVILSEDGSSKESAHIGDRLFVHICL